MTAKGKLLALCLTGPLTGARLSTHFTLSSDVLHAYLQAVEAPVFTFRGQHQGPGVSIAADPAPDVPPRTTPAASGHGSNTRTRIRQSEKGLVQMLEEQHQSSCWAITTETSEIRRYVMAQQNLALK